MNEETTNLAQQTEPVQKRKFLPFIITAAVALIVLIVSISIYNTPTNRIRRQLDLGNKYLEEENYEQAIVEFDKVIEIDPISVEAYLGKAQAYMGMGNTGMAVQTLEHGYEMTEDEAIQKVIQEIDHVIEWKDKVMEKLLREYIGKPKGDVYWSDVWGIQELSICGDYLMMNFRGMRATEEGIGISAVMFNSCSGNEIEITERGNIQTFDDLQYLVSLRRLSIIYQKDFQIDDSRIWDNLTNLAYLDLQINNISDISGLSNLVNLTDLHLGFNNINDISGLSNLVDLTDLELMLNNISDIGALSNLVNLTSLHLGINNISDISALSNLVNLTNLNIAGNNISDISALNGLSNLQYLNLLDNNITDYSPVSSVPNLMR